MFDGVDDVWGHAVDSRVCMFSKCNLLVKN